MPRGQTVAAGASALDQPMGMFRTFGPEGAASYVETARLHRKAGGSMLGGMWKGISGVWSETSLEEIVPRIGTKGVGKTVLTERSVAATIIKAIESKGAREALSGAKFGGAATGTARREAIIETLSQSSFGKGLRARRLGAVARMGAGAFGLSLLGGGIVPTAGALGAAAMTRFALTSMKKTPGVPGRLAKLGIGMASIFAGGAANYALGGRVRTLMQGARGSHGTRNMPIIGRRPLY